MPMSLRTCRPRSVGVFQLVDVVPERVAVAHRPEHAAAHVLEHAHAREDVGDLEAARQPHAVDLVRAAAGDVPPRSRMRPVVGTYFAVIRLYSVDLPAPFGPMMAWRSPCTISRLTPRITSVGPKLLCRSISSMAARHRLAPRVTSRAGRFPGRGHRRRHAPREDEAADRECARTRSTATRLLDVDASSRTGASYA